MKDSHPLKMRGKDYHLVARHEVGSYTAEKRTVLELRLRIDHSRRLFGGKYDYGHAKWMAHLSRNLSAERMVTEGITLNEYKVIRNIEHNVKD